MYLPQLRVADVRTGDLDDEVTLLQPPRPPGLISELGATFPLYADGGVGNDHLSAEDSDGELYGGPGDDRLSGSKALDGGGGRDELYGDSRNETFSDGDLDGAAGDAAPGPDLIDGGGGNDTVSYRQRRTSVSVSLAAERAGSLGEADVVRGVESIIGGNGDDLLQGDDGPNMIDGQQGRDKLIGGGGDDQFVNGRGKITCGDGVDLVVSPRASDRLGRGCEQITTVLDGEDIFAAYPFKRGMRSVWFAIHCPSRAREDLAGRYRCSARMTITEAAGARRRIAAGTSARGRWAHRAVRLPLTRVGRQLAASRRLVPAVVSLSIDGGELPTLRWGILL